MRVHLFKIEQFFEEQCVLDAELKYPFTTVTIEEVSPDKMTLKVGDLKVKISLDPSHEHITGLHCECASFSENQECIHVVMAAWEFRKKGFPKEYSKKSHRIRYKTSSLIDSIQERDLKQFLSGYAKRNTEFKELLKLLFSHEMDDQLSFEQVQEQLFKIYSLYRTKLNVKKYRKRLEFYLKTYLGIAEDLITQKNYRTAAYHLLSSWNLFQEKTNLIFDLEEGTSIYQQILKILNRLESDTMSPELYKFVLAKLQLGLEDENYTPVTDYDLPELLRSWGQMPESEYLDLIFSKFKNSKFPENWLLRFLHNIDSFTQSQREKAIPVIKRIASDTTYRKLLLSENTLHPEALILIFKSLNRFSKEHLLQMKKVIAPEFVFLIRLEVIRQFRDLTQVEILLYETEYSEEAQQLLSDYLEIFELPTWVKLLLSQHLLGHDDKISEIKEISDPKEWIHVLPHLKKDHQKKILEELESYVLNYAKNHIGLRAKTHLESIGKLLGNQGFEKEWKQIQLKLVDKFAHRSTLQSMNKMI